jgi:prepilin-type N-terminal cleavage/methylation domain-containing protein
MKTSRHRAAAFTLPELLTTIAILGVLSGIAIGSYAGLHQTAREAVARDTSALLNRAVLHFSQANWEIALSPVANSTADELAVLRALQWQDPATPGSGFIPLTFDDTTSSSQEDYRLRWNGTAFEVLLPGASGSGLKTGKVQTGGSGTAYVFPDGYTLPGPGQHE